VLFNSTFTQSGADVRKTVKHSQNGNFRFANHINGGVVAACHDCIPAQNRIACTVPGKYQAIQLRRRCGRTPSLPYRLMQIGSNIFVNPCRPALFRKSLPGTASSVAIPKSGKSGRSVLHMPCLNIITARLQRRVKLRRNHIVTHNALHVKKLF
jgi:hypothetical protein